jgi:hypothetical protein
MVITVPIRPAGDICLFECFEPQEQFFSNLTAVTITGDKASNLDLFLAGWFVAVRVLLSATPTATQDIRF